MDTRTQFETLLKDAIKETGVTMTQSAKEVAQYMHDRALHLSSIVDQPGFDQALRAERNSVAMRAGLKLADNAEAADQRIIGIIQGALGIAAGALA
jgi:hypothetical protein